MIQSITTSANLSSFSLESSGRLAAKATQRTGAGDSSGRTSGAPGQLSPEEQRLVQELKQIDRKVRAHEQAHLSVGADLVRSSASYSYQTGPDNQRYAVAGEVSIDASPGRTAEETIPKAQHIRATALAPADPSPQDRSIAARASSMEAEAKIELSVQKREDSTSTERDANRLYQGVAQGKGSSSPVGGRLDLFA